MTATTTIGTKGTQSERELLRPESHSLKKSAPPVGRTLAGRALAWLPAEV